MAIVLAIEPDRRQAAHLTAIARHLVGAELVLADTTEGALDAIGNRVPDLVLVPALLSPQDDAALAAALRVIAAAAHVRTLTIPVLASGTKRKPVEGMLAKWRRSRSASPEPDGCEPAVFGEQISAYLKEAAAERAELEGAPFEQEPADTRFQHDAPAPAFDPTFEEFEPAALIEVRAIAEVKPPAPPTPAEQLWADAREPNAAEPLALSAEAAGGTDARADEAGEEPLIDLSDELADLSEDEGSVELFDGERVGVYTISAELEEPAIEAFDLLPCVLEPTLMADATRDVTEDAAAVPTALDAAVDAVPEAAWDESSLVEPLAVEPVFVESMLVESVDAEPAVVEAPESPGPDIERWVPMFLTPGRMWPALEGMPAEVPLARSEQPDWIELVASLRQDLQRRRTEPASAEPEPIAARPSDGAKAEIHRLVKKQKSPAKKARPVQDEWGFFDPEQCGFSTLLAKLDEITEDLPGG